MASNYRREQLVTQLVHEQTPDSHEDSSAIWQMRVRMGYNWKRYMFASYDPEFFARQSARQEVRSVQLVGNTVDSIMLGGQPFYLVPMD